MPPGAAVEPIAAADNPEAGERGPPEATSTTEGRRHDKGNKLCENRSGESRPCPVVLVPSPQQQRHAKQTRRFIYYIGSHLELDGESHGPMGRELL